MRKITIVGAGHAGLQLGIGLLGHGYEVTILSNRTAEEVGSGKILSSQSMYDMAVGFERDLQLAFWDDSCPAIDGVHIRAGNAQMGMPVDFRARMQAPGQSVDQRLKMPRWMKEFEARGGKLVIADVGIAELEFYAATSDLVIVAAGKGEIGKMFARDDQRSVFDKPQRAIALTYVHGMVPREDFTALNININPGIGELVHFPGLTLSGACDIINLEGIPGGAMDRWDSVKTPEEHLAMTKTLIAEFFPHEAHRFENIRLTDDNGILAGRFTPTVRRGLGELPSGQHVLGIGDILMLNDPMTGQGSNNASKAAHLFMHAILKHGNAAFDKAWMHALLESCWNHSQWAMRFTNSLLVPPAPHIFAFLQACGEVPALASKFANSFNDPRTLSSWYFDAETTEQLVDAAMPVAA